MRTSCCTRSIWKMDDSSSVWAIMTPLVSPAAIRSRILQENGKPVSAGRQGLRKREGNAPSPFERGRSRRQRGFERLSRDSLNGLRLRLVLFVEA